MKRVALSVTVASAFALAACGGGGGAKSTPVAAPKQNANGGVVTAEPTKGIIGPATTVDPQGAKTIGKSGPLSPKENRPTEAQQNGVAGTAACASTSANPSSSNMGAMSAAILCLLNGERAAKGLPALHANGKLAKAAKGWAKTMVARRFFAHESGSSTLLSRVKKTGYVKGSWSIGENIAWGSGVLATPRSIVNGWMHSPGHKANILHGAFRDIGIGIKLGAPGAGLSGGATYVTDFGKHS
jgi:uncharacterized protein YkwD